MEKQIFIVISGDRKHIYAAFDTLKKAWEAADKINDIFYNTPEDWSKYTVIETTLNSDT